MKNSVLTLFALLTLVGGSWAGAQDFSAKLPDGNMLYLSVTDTTAKTVAVTFENRMGRNTARLQSGRVEIPSSVRYKEVSYRVTAIGDKAFSGAQRLTDIILPPTLERIGAGAFEDCPLLRSVVFPGRQVEIGEGAFARCPAIQAISFGSDWTSIDMSAFSGADSLRTVGIPARVRQLTHLGLLTALERVEVDPNNPTFSSQDGLLYTKDGKAFLTCPRGRQGSIVVADGTETVLEGAFAGCRELTEISLPATVRTLSYQEFSGCAALRSLTLASPIPPTTALAENVPVFALRVASAGLELFVPAEARTLYLAALKSQAGNYTNMTGGQASSCKEEELLGRNQIKAIRKK